MVSVRALKNQYAGINAHLHSFWQGEGGWSGFHTLQIAHILSSLKGHLRPLGYTVEAEESLQIRRVGAPSEAPRADLLIYDLEPQRVQPASPAASASQTISILELFDEEEVSEKPYRALVIHKVDPTTLRASEPVAWLELLSPSNKGESDDAEAYRAKRMKVLANDLVFVEIDYLHETPPTFHTLANYRPVRGRRDPKAHPYRIIVIDPRPNFVEGQAQVAEFSVDEPIPLVNIPLNAGDIVTFDFGIPYRKTFEEAFYGDQVDYRQLPLNFDRYSPADQLRIVRRMLTVLAAAQQGHDLENLPLPIQLPEMDLETALSTLTTY